MPKPKSQKKQTRELWSKIQPKTQAERKAVHNKCGQRCFLAPVVKGARLRYPMCPKLGIGRDCQVQRSAAIAAEKDAVRTRNPEMKKRSLKLLGKRL